MPSRADDERSGPLSHITVVDLTRVLAGPYSSRIMRDLGARVIKVELPRSGDVTRHTAPLVERDPAHPRRSERYDVSADQRSGYFAMANTGKESIALDLKDSTDKQVLDALCSSVLTPPLSITPGCLIPLRSSRASSLNTGAVLAGRKADILLENFSPGVMKSLGYDWETVHRRWPSLIMASISGRPSCTS